MTDTGPDTAPTTMLVAGFLGTGKTRIVQALTGEDPDAEAGVPPFRGRPSAAGDAGGPAGRSVIEASPFTVPMARQGQIVVTAVDAVNAAGNLGDADFGELVAGQIGAADLVVLTCGDFAEPGPARRAVAALTSAPIVEAHAEADLGRAIRDQAMPRPAGDGAAADHRSAFTVWTYSGSATLTADALQAFLAGRPAGAYRIRGTVRLQDAGAAVDVFGRVRRIAAIDQPEMTRLVVAGPASRLSGREMDLAFAEAVAAAAYERGAIACR